MGLAFNMDAATITNILVMIVGGLIVILLSVVGFFVSSLIKEVKTTSKSVLMLSSSVEKLTITVESFKSESSKQLEDIHTRLEHHHEEIEMLRTSRHLMTGWITSIRLMGELKNGWKFKSEWELPGIGNVLKRHNGEDI